MSYPIGIRLDWTDPFGVHHPEAFAKVALTTEHFLAGAETIVVAYYADQDAQEAGAAQLAAAQFEVLAAWPGILALLRQVGIVDWAYARLAEQPEFADATPVMGPDGIIGMALSYDEFPTAFGILASCTEHFLVNPQQMQVAAVWATQVAHDEGYEPVARWGYRVSAEQFAALLELLRTGGMTTAVYGYLHNLPEFAAGTIITEA